MVLRMLEIYHPEATGERVREILKDRPIEGVWTERLEEDLNLVRILLATEEAEGVIEVLNAHFGRSENFRILVLPVSGMHPRQRTKEEATKDLGEEARADARSIFGGKFRRVSREELYTEVTQMTELSKVYLLLMALAAVVASIGIIRDDWAIVIGSMVIAPLIGPNVGLALATTLGDFSLARRALKANAAGLAVAIGVTVLIGFLFRGLPITPDMPQVVFRTRVGLEDIGLAMAAGAAGSMAMSTRAPAVIVGVMVAVALVPPLAVFGLMLGSGHWAAALGSFLLLQSYLIGINLSAVVAFLAQGLRPMTWWEEERARQTTRWSLVLWVSLLLALAAIILLVFPP